MFVCPGCKSRFRVTKAPKSGKVKCPKCGLVSAIGADAVEPPAGGPAAPKPPASAPAVPKPPPAPELAAGTVIAGHKIAEYVAGTEFTESYKAAQTSMGRTVLFKALRRKYAADKTVKARFFAGARAVAKLNHPNLLSVFDMGEQGGLCFFTTEFVEGGTLPAFLKNQENISAKDRLPIATQIALALTHAESEGVTQIWLGPKDVLLTDKGDVRLDRVGAGAPLEGGAPEPVANVLRRLLFLTITGKDLPPEARGPGGGSEMSLPMARDQVGGRLSAILTRALSDDEDAYKTAGDIADELEKLSEGLHRRSTVSATTTPGGVVPIRLERARRRQMPIKTFLVAGVLVAGLCVAAGLVVRGQIRNRQADELWVQACREVDEDRLYDALRTFSKLAGEYGDTDPGKETGNKISDLKNLIVDRKYDQTEAEFRRRPEDAAKAIAAIKAAQAKLKQELNDWPRIDKQAEVSIKNVLVLCDNAAKHDWQKNVSSMVRAYCGEDRMEYGQALEKMEIFKKTWDQSEWAEKLADEEIAGIKDKAAKRFADIETEVKQLWADGNTGKAEDLLDRVIKNFGIPEHVRRAEELKDQQDGSHE